MIASLASRGAELIMPKSVGVKQASAGTQWAGLEASAEYAAENSMRVELIYVQLQDTTLTRQY